jgi:hypothetical protein
MSSEKLGVRAGWESEMGLRRGRRCGRPPAGGSVARLLRRDEVGIGASWGAASSAPTAAATGWGLLRPKCASFSREVRKQISRVAVDGGHAWPGWL